ncbi:MAG TPA: hypothetical protein VGD53_26025, partial [Actinoallomurus sp.]
MSYPGDQQQPGGWRPFEPPQSPYGPVEDQAGHGAPPYDNNNPPYDNPPYDDRPQGGPYDDPYGDPPREGGFG